MTDHLASWIPEGYTVHKIQTFEFDDWSTVAISFCGDDMPTFRFSAYIYDDLEQMQHLTFEKDGTPVQEQKLSNGNTVYFYENSGYKKSVCQDKNIIYSISGDLTEESVINILDSV